MKSIPFRPIIRIPTSQIHLICRTREDTWNTIKKRFVRSMSLNLLKTISFKERKTFSFSLITCGVYKHASRFFFTYRNICHEQSKFSFENYFRRHLQLPEFLDYMNLEMLNLYLRPCSRTKLQNNVLYNLKPTRID